MGHLELCTFFLLLVGIHGLPKYNVNNLTSDSIVGALGHAESNATAQGPGSTVGISGIVTGSSNSSMGAASSPSEGPSSSLSSAANCSQYSTSHGSGSSGAEAVSSGGCETNVDNSGIHQVSRVEIGMESQVGQVNMTSADGMQLQSSVNEAQIVHASSQNTSNGTADAYQYVSGPQAQTQFSGIMANAHSSADNAVAGTSETVMTHSLGSTIIESVFVPYESASEAAASVPKPNFEDKPKQQSS